MTQKHPLFDAIARASDLGELLHIQMLDLPAVRDFELRLALREALAARHLVIKATNMAQPAAGQTASGLTIK